MDETSTIGTSLGNLVFGAASQCEFSLASERDVATTSERLAKVFHDVALPYFGRFSSLAAVDAELNDKPLAHTRNRGFPWLRCSTGIIVAKLVGRSNYRELVDVYRGVLAKVDAFHIPNYNALENRLETVEPVSDDGGVSST